MTGWGQTSDMAVSDVLKKAHMEVMSNDACTKETRKLFLDGKPVQEISE